MCISVCIAAWLWEEYANSVCVVRRLDLEHHRTVPHSTLLSLRAGGQGIVPESVETIDVN